MTNRILIIESDFKMSQSVIEALGPDFEVKTVNPSEALSQVLSFSPAIVVLDGDLKDIDPIRLFKKIKTTDPKIDTVIISSSSDIPTAVLATKAGVSDYFMKPLDGKKFAESIKKILQGKRSKAIFIDTDAQGLEWLNGVSIALRDFLFDIEKVLENNLDVLIVGEQGINKTSIAEIIHKNGSLKDRKFVELNLSSFKSEDGEKYFWSALQQLIQERTYTIDTPSEICGTIFLNGLENLSIHYVRSIVTYLNKRKTYNNIDTEIRVIVSVDDSSKLADLEKEELLSNFVKLFIPSLRQRREDIYIISDLYLKKANKKYDKDIKYISFDVLKLFLFYDWPGNYEQLENLVEYAVLNASGNALELKNLPTNIEFLSSVVLNKTLSGCDLRIEKLRRNFEFLLFKLVLEKTNYNEEDASSILDIPKDVFSERIRQIGVLS